MWVLNLKNQSFYIYIKSKMKIRIIRIFDNIDFFSIFCGNEIKEKNVVKMRVGVILLLNGYDLILRNRRGV